MGDKGAEAGQNNFEKIISDCYLGVKNGKKMSTATSLLSRLSHELIVKIVRLISAGESGKVEDELKAIKGVLVGE